MKTKIQNISEKVVPYANKFSQHKWVKSISGGIMYVIPFTLIASIFTILATPPVTQAILDQGGWYASLMGGWFNFAQTYKSVLSLPANMTLGMMSIIAVIGISYRLAHEVKLKNPLTATFTALIMFLLVASPSTTAYLVSAVNAGTEISTWAATTVLDTTYLGSQGLFVAIIVAVASVEITSFLTKKNFVIKMPDAIPESVAAPFNALIPVLVNLLFFFALNIIATNNGTTIPSFIMSALMPAIGNANTYWGMILIFLISNLLWFFGVHGAAVTMMLYIPLQFQLTGENAMSVAAGGAAVWNPINIASFSIAYIGLNVAILLVAKSKQLKTVGKVALIPNIFGINEPTIFGVPVVFNLYFLIPHLLAPTLQMTAAYFLGKAGLLAGPYNILYVSLPLGMNTLFSTMSVLTTVLQVGVQLLGTLVWIPFVKMYDRQLIRGEQEAEALSQKTAQAEELG